MAFCILPRQLLQRLQALLVPWFSQSSRVPVAAWQDTREGASGPAGTAAERTGRPGVGGRGGGATPTGAKNAGESPRRGSVGGEAAAGRPPMSRLVDMVLGEGGWWWWW